MKIIITKHARIRFIQRFKMMFSAHYFYSSQFTDSLITSLVEKLSDCQWHMGSPFYKNKVESIYGPTIVRKLEAAKTIHFILHPRGHHLVLTTVVENFDPHANIQEIK